MRTQPRPLNRLQTTPLFPHPSIYLLAYLTSRRTCTLRTVVGGFSGVRRLTLGDEILELGKGKYTRSHSPFLSSTVVVHPFTKRVVRGGDLVFEDRVEESGTRTTGVRNRDARDKTTDPDLSRYMIPGSLSRKTLTTPNTSFLHVKNRKQDQCL